MSKDEESAKGFKIKDRRRFTADGEVRPDAPVDPPKDEKASARQPPESPPREPPQQEEGNSGQRTGLDFMSFIASLATNALAAFGALPKEQAQGLPVNPELGREYVQILSMLQEKTHGNLTQQEDAALQRIITDLRMAYVQITKQEG
ncbi:DUF1844 domain-containing protein [Myxococcota bacterium]